MASLIKKIFSSVPRPPKELELINNLEKEIEILDDAGLRAESLKIKEAIFSGADLNEFLPRAFALVREAAKRALSQRHFDVQFWGGIVLHQGAIAEMSTGEGKTLAATAPTYLNALSGKGVHLITVNDYLAKRDAVWMGQVYNLLGLKTGCIAHNSAYIYDPEWRASSDEKKEIDKDRDEKGGFLVHEEYLRPVSRKEAYSADITYGTNHEFGFDYLRDNLVQSKEMKVQRELNFAIIDEVDSILIDEARTPLIISVPDKESSEFYKVFARAVRNLKQDEDYAVDEKLKTVEINNSGIDKIEGMLGIKDIYAPENLRLVHYLEASLKARALFDRDKDYVVRSGEVILVDQFTGRLMLGRRYSSGLHQAIEAKEGVLVKEESKTYAQITIQNYFRLYKKISGMTGTAQTSAEEFHKVYGLEVVSVPTNKPLVRADLPDVIFRTQEAKYKAIVEEIRDRNKKGQPILIGTVSIEKNELLGNILKREGINCEVLNAKNHEREGSIIAQAGKSGSVTVATNMAGRGVDIILGGNPPDSEEARKVRDLGGLHVIGTERHEARRIDNQLRGRAGRQGDPGSSQFFVSLEDDIARIFGGDRVKGLMDKFNMPDALPASKMVSGSIQQAQSKVEGFNFDMRKHLLEYDDILNKQRLKFYEIRAEVLDSLENEVEIKTIVRRYVDSQFEKMKNQDIPREELIKIFEGAGLKSEFKEDEDVLSVASKDIEERINNHKNIRFVGLQFLSLLDFMWMNHLENIEALMESVRLRAYAQKDPLVEYRRESFMFFEALRNNIEMWLLNNVLKLENVEDKKGTVSTSAPKDIKISVKDKVGRNDPCPCGSGKKYKKCHGK
ncbi:MAG TPA: preprotein translocase subunit SecA [Candidatus Paceibacterota bacterium]